MLTLQFRLQPAVLPSGASTRKPSPSWLSTSGSPSPAWIVLQTNGFWCGPEKIGSLNRVIRQPLRRDPPPPVVHADPVAAEPQAVDQADERAALALERVGHVGAVAQHAKVLRMPRIDAYQRVAAADLVGAARDHVDVDVMCRRRRREDAEQHEPGHGRSHVSPLRKVDVKHLTQQRARSSPTTVNKCVRTRTFVRARCERGSSSRSCPCVALAIAALTAVAVTAASSAQRDAVYGEMSELIGREANRFDARARADMAAAQDLAAALEADSSISREHGRDVVRRFAERRPELLGVWAAFEPNAFDGRDAEYTRGRAAR